MSVSQSRDGVRTLIVSKEEEHVQLVRSGRGKAGEHPEDEREDLSWFHSWSNYAVVAGVSTVVDSVFFVNSRVCLVVACLRDG